MSLTPPDGYLATSPAGKGKAAMVLHPWWGLNETIKAFCRRLAEAGFVVFAPDLYHGTVTDQIAEAEKLVHALDSKAEQVIPDLVAAMAYLKERAETDTLAVIGFSMGAYYALELSAQAPDSVRAIVIFYGTGPADFSKSKAAYLGHFAEKDPYEPSENVSGLEEALKAAGRPVTFYQYNGAGHWFFEEDRADAYDAAAATLAWDRTLAFLNE